MMSKNEYNVYVTMCTCIYTPPHLPGVAKPEGTHKEGIGNDVITVQTKIEILVNESQTRSYASRTSLKWHHSTRIRNI